MSMPNVATSQLYEGAVLAKRYAGRLPGDEMEGFFRCLFNPLRHLEPRKEGHDDDDDDDANEDHVTMVAKRHLCATSCTSFSITLDLETSCSRSYSLDILLYHHIMARYIWLYNDQPKISHITPITSN